MSLFSKIPVSKPNLTPFNLGHPVAFSHEFGQLSPVQCEKTIPGDIFLCGLHHQDQFAPLATKLYQDFRVKSETFFVPTRIIWKDFEKFFVEEDNTIQEPYFTLRSLISLFVEFLVADGNRTFSPGVDDHFCYNVLCNVLGDNSIFKYLYGHFFDLTDYSDLFSLDLSDKSLGLKFSNLPILDRKLSALRIVAYWKIMCEYYLDENLQAQIIDKFEDLFGFDNPGSGQFGSPDWSDKIAYFCCFLFNYYLGQDSYSLTTPLFIATYTPNSNLHRGFVYRCWPKDYFTGALPFLQKGNAVEIPMTGNGTFELQLDDAFITQYSNQNTAETNVGFTVASDQSGVPAGFKRVYIQAQTSDGGTNFGTVDTSPLQFTATVGGLSCTIEDFRTAYQLQEWLERNARGGTRYKEQIFSHFGVHTKDSRLDRPEFVFGSTDGMNYGNVFTTNQDVSGNGVPAESISCISSGGRSRYASYKVTEHGFYISLYCIYPKAGYYQGIYRQAMELDKFDYYWPEFQHLGEQEVNKLEVHSHNSDTVFGYQPRYAQYKCRTAQIHGEFCNTLKTFTAARDLSLNVALDGRFISIIPQFNGLNRIFNYVNTDFSKLYSWVYVDLRALRPMDYYGVPRLQL